MDAVFRKIGCVSSRDSNEKKLQLTSVFKYILIKLRVLRKKSYAQRAQSSDVFQELRYVEKTRRI